MKQRIITAAITLPLFLAALWFLPQLYWSFFLLVVLTIASKEWIYITSMQGSRRILFAIGMFFLLTLATVMVNYAEGFLFIYLSNILRFSLVFYFLVLVIWIVIIPLALVFKWKLQDNLKAVFLGWAILLGVFLSAFFLHKQPLDLLLILVLVWTADSSAYFIGKAYGKHFIAPGISPKKTWEGFIGSIVSTIVVVYLLQYAVSSDAYSELLKVNALVLGLFVALFAFIGDLFESLLKRQAGLKDSGNLLPGHGGVLDRIDSVLPVVTIAPAVINTTLLLYVFFISLL